MMNSEHFTVLAGNPAKWDAETLTRVRPGQYAGTYNSEDLCSVQVDQWSRGRRSAVLTSSMYGWSVRIDSGLGDRQILAGSRRGEKLDGTKEDAIRWGKAWAEEDPENREFYARNSDLGSSSTVTE